MNKNLAMGILIATLVAVLVWCFVEMGGQRRADAQVKAVFLGMNQLLVDDLDVRQFAESEGYDRRSLDILEASRDRVTGPRQQLCGQQPEHWLCEVDWEYTLVMQRVDVTLQEIRRELGMQSYQGGHHVRMGEGQAR